MTNKNKQLIKNIDHCLPQTQCELCGYKGCLPYAKAIAAGKDDIAQCHPGGLQTLRALAKLTKQDPAHYEAAVLTKQKPRLVAIIDETLCIGCTKCISACPVDAIIGSSKQMHTVITDACTGCELCLDPCPMDCIDLKKLNTDEPIDSSHARTCYYQHKARHQSRQAEQQLKRANWTRTTQNKPLDSVQSSTLNKQALIAAAVERAKARKKK